MSVDSEAQVGENLSESSSEGCSESSEASFNSASEDFLSYDDSAEPIGHVRYINILTWLRGFLVKLLYLVLFSLYLGLFWELEDKRNLKNL